MLRLPRHGASCPVAIAVSCSADRQALGKITAEGVFLEDLDVPATNNACEREIRPSVVFRKVTGGFRSDWGAQIHAGYRSVTGTARLHRQTALQSIGQLLAGTFEQTLLA